MKYPTVLLALARTMVSKMTGFTRINQIVICTVWIVVVGNTVMSATEELTVVGQSTHDRLCYDDCVFSGSDLLTFDPSQYLIDNLSRDSVKPGSAELSSPSNHANRQSVIVYTSSMSGNWNEPSTWGGLGVPGPTDEVVVSPSTVVRLVSEVFVFKLRISGGGNIDLNGNSVNLVGDGASFVFGGSLDNGHPTLGTINFVGNGVPGAVNQFASGGGGCIQGNKCNLEMRLKDAVKVTVLSGSLPGLTLSRVSLRVDQFCVLDASNGLDFFGGNAVISNIVNNGSILNGTVTNRRLVRVINTGTFNSDLSILGGTTRLDGGSFSGTVGVSSGSTRLILGGPTSLYGDLFISSSTVDLSGHSLEFRGNNKVFSNSGIIANSGEQSSINFVGNGTVGGITQQYGSGNPIPSNISIRCSGSTTLVLPGSGSYVSQIAVDFGSTLDIRNRELVLTGVSPLISAAGTILASGSLITLQGTTPQLVPDLGASPYNNLRINNPSGVSVAFPLIVTGTLFLNDGLFTTNGNLTIANNAIVARSLGSLSETPIYTSLPTIRYYGFSPITAGFELPANGLLNDLVTETGGTLPVTFNKDVTVDRTLSIASGSSFLGGSGRTLLVRGPNVGNSGTISVPTVVFSGSVAQTFGGNGIWIGENATATTSSISALNGFRIAFQTFTNLTTINTGSSFFVVTGGSLINRGVINGNVNAQGTSVFVDANSTGFNAQLFVFGASVIAKGLINSSLTVQPAPATLTVPDGEFLTITGNATLNGVLGGNGTVRVNGASISNSATVSVAEFQMGGTTQSLSGTGGFEGNRLTVLPGSTTTLTANKQLATALVSTGSTLAISTRTLALSGPGTPLVVDGTFSNGNGTVEYNGAMPQSISPTVPTYFNLTLGNIGAVTAPASLTISNLLRIKSGSFVISNATIKDVLIDAGSNLVGIAGSTNTVSGNWTCNGTTSPNSNTVVFSGLASQTISGASPSRFGNLVSGGIQPLNLSQNVTVDGNLNLQNDIVTGNNIISMHANGTSSGEFDVIGTVRRTGFVGGGGSLSFGNPNNSISFAGLGLVPNEVLVRLRKMVPAGLPDAVQRTYSISQVGGLGYSAKLRLRYLDSELNGNVESNLKLFRLDSAWSQQGLTSIDTRSNWIEKANVLHFSDWAIKSADPLAPRIAPFDFDGDGFTDIGIYRPNGANGSEWWLQRSSNGGTFATQFGAPTDSVAPADYTGDGKADVAFWRPSTGFWYVLRSEDQTFYAFPFGATGDTPVPADYDGDGKADAAVFRESAVTWYINKSSGGTDIVGFGAAGDKPVNADYDGDGKADIAIYRPTGSQGPGASEWWVRRSSNGVVFALQFGSSTDKAVPGDYTGDGKTDVAFWRPANGNWFVLRSEDFSFFAFPFGANGDTAVPGDYDGDGRWDAGVFRPSNNTWFVQRSTAGTLIQQFGITGDVPLPSAYIR